ncbi:MAG: hypothetical protein DA408_15495 [Bacteroidetes bacterium]|nr:MAG: hypothetical protein C7N36_19130 [Bacteroidota bacterium]PTM10652.1 MAG: hypothetical protein DA408_15495 [Bacteroidota bacterium]
MQRKRLHQLFIGTVESQLANNNPPFVRSTLARLESEGYSTEQATAMMAGIVAQLMADMIANDELFDETRYQQLLLKLPELPHHGEI